LLPLPFPSLQADTSATRPTLPDTDMHAYHDDERQTDLVEDEHDVKPKRGARKTGDLDLCEWTTVAKLHGEKCCEKKDAFGNPAYCLLNVDVATLVQIRTNIHREADGVTARRKGLVKNKLVEELAKIAVVERTPVTTAGGLLSEKIKITFPHKLAYDSGRKTKEGQSILETRKVCGQAWALAYGIGKNVRTAYEADARSLKLNKPVAPTMRTLK